MSIKEFHYRATYHTAGYADFRVFAETPEQAKEIATRMFYEKHTDKCVLDSVMPTQSKAFRNYETGIGVSDL